MNKTEQKLDYLQKAYNLPVEYAKKLLKPKFIIKKIKVKFMQKPVKRIKTKAVYPAIHKPYVRNTELESYFEDNELIDVEWVEMEVEKLKRAILIISLSIFVLLVLFIYLLKK